jgi:hypothetical protein
MKPILILFLALALVMQNAECAMIKDIITGTVGKSILNTAQFIQVNYTPTFEQDLIKAGVDFLSGSKMIIMPLLTTGIPATGTGAYISFTLYVPIDNNPIPVNNIANAAASAASKFIFGK